MNLYLTNYDLMDYAFKVSEIFDFPVGFRISGSAPLVRISLSSGVFSLKGHVFLKTKFIDLKYNINFSLKKND